MTTVPTPIDINFEIRLDPDVRQAYEHIYSAEGIRQLDSFYLWLLHILHPLQGRTLLDVACGEATLPLFARSRYGLDAYGVDLSLGALQIGQKEGAGPLCAAGGDRLPFADASFDYVTCIGSLEHFENIRAGITEMRRVLRPDGYACILLPNTYSLLNNIYKAFKTGMSTIDAQPLQRYAARAEWAMLLESEGLHVVDTIKYEREAPRSLGDALWYLRHPRSLVKLALTPLMPINLASCLVYICQPRPQA